MEKQEGAPPAHDCECDEEGEAADDGGLHIVQREDVLEDSYRRLLVRLLVEIRELGRLVDHQRLGAAK